MAIKFGKRLVSAVVSVAMVMGLMATSVFAAEGDKKVTSIAIDQAAVSFDNGTAEASILSGLSTAATLSISVEDDSGNYSPPTDETTTVSWTLSTYDSDLKGEQTLTATGTVVTKGYTLDTGVSATVSVTVTVRAAVTTALTAADYSVTVDNGVAGKTEAELKAAAATAFESKFNVTGTFSVTGSVPTTAGTQVVLSSTAFTAKTGYTPLSGQDTLTYTYIVPAATEPTPPAPAPSTTSSSTPYVAPVTVKGSGDGTAKLVLASAQLPTGVSAADVSLKSSAIAADHSVVGGVKATLSSANLPAVKDISILDLNLVDKDGATVKFTGNATVVLPVPAGFGSFLRVFYVNDNGNLEEVPAVLKDGGLEITVAHFSKYAIVDFATSAGKISSTITASAQNTPPDATTAGNDSSSNPKTGAAAVSVALAMFSVAAFGAVKARKK